MSTNSILKSSQRLVNFLTFFSSSLSLSLSHPHTHAHTLSLHSLMQAFIYYRGTVHHLDKWYLCPIHTLPIFFSLFFLPRMEVFCSNFESNSWTENWSFKSASKSKMLELFFKPIPGFMAHWTRCPFLILVWSYQLVFYKSVPSQWELLIIMSCWRYRIYFISEL